jgi:hypothetical protein
VDDKLAGFTQDGIDAEQTANGAVPGQIRNRFGGVAIAAQE